MGLPVGGGAKTQKTDLNRQQRSLSCSLASSARQLCMQDESPCHLNSRMVSHGHSCELSTTHARAHAGHLLGSKLWPRACALPHSERHRLRYTSGGD